MLKNTFFTGAHRTGKTTLAYDHSSTNDLTFIALPTSTILEELDCSYDYNTMVNPIDDIIYAHKELLYYYIEVFSYNKSCVFDRSILDVIAYANVAIKNNSVNGNEPLFSDLYSDVIGEYLEETKNDAYYITEIDDTIIPQKTGDKYSDYYMSLEHRHDIQYEINLLAFKYGIQLIDITWIIN